MADANLNVKINAEDSFSGVFSHFNSALGGIASAATAPISAIGSMVDHLGKIGLAVSGAKDILNGFASTFGGPVMAASDVNEAMNKVQVVFGDAADSVMEFARTSATGLGQSQATALGAVGTFGNLFVSMGLSGQAAAGMSKDVVSLASDLASFNNIRPEEALEKLRSGLVGEAEPLRSLGVNLSAAAIEAKALETNVGKTKDTLTAADKATASFALILEQTKTAQGDFARTSTGFANAQRVIAAQFDDLKASIGQAFLPTVEKLVGVFSTMLPGAMGVLEGPIAAAGEAFADLAQEVLTFVKTVQNIHDADGVDWITAAITALELRIGEVFGGTAQAAFHAFIDVVTTVADIAGNVFNRIMEYVADFVTVIQQAFAGDIAGATSGLIDILTLIADDIVDVLMEWTRAFFDWVTNTANVLTDGMGGSILDAVLNFIVQAVPQIADFISGWVDAFLDWFPEAYAGYLTSLGGLVGMVLDWIAARGPEFITVFLTEWVPAFVGWVVDVGTRIVPLLVDLVAGIGGWLISTGIPKLLIAIVAIAEAIGNGLVIALEKAIPMIGAAFAKLGESGIAAFKRVLGIASPSAEMQALGEFIVEGLALGIDDAAGVADTAMGDLADAIGAKAATVLTASEVEIAKYQKALAADTDKYQRTTEDAEQKHLQKLADLQADYLAAKPKERKAIQDKIDAENEAYQRATEDRERNHNRTLEDMAETHGANMAAAAEREANDRATALQRLQTGLADVESGVATGLEAIGQRTGQRINDAISQASAAIADATQRAEQSINAAGEAINLSREIRGRRAEFSAGQQAQADARRTAQEDADLAANQAKDVASYEAKVNADAAATKRKREREDADTAYKLAADLTARTGQLSRDLVGVTGKDEQDKLKAKAAADIADINNKAKIAATDRARQRALDDADIAYKVANDRQMLADKQAADIAALAAKRARDADERAFREKQQADAQAFSDGLDNEALARQIQRITDERDARITGINDALADKQRQITEDAATESTKLVAAAQDRIAKLKAEFFDKVGPLAAGAQASINGYIDAVSNRIGALHAAATAAAAAVASVTGQSVSTSTALSTALTNATSSAATALQTTVGSTYGTVGNTTIEQGRGRGGYAEGGRSLPGGVALVGERGPELVQMPGGANVYNNTDTRAMLAGGGDDGRPVVIMLDSQVLARATWKQLKRLNLSGATLGLT